MFQTQFFNRPYSTKHSLICYKISYCVYFTLNAKIDEKQTYPKHRNKNSNILCTSKIEEYDNIYTHKRKIRSVIENMDNSFFL